MSPWCKFISNKIYYLSLFTYFVLAAKGAKSTKEEMKNLRGKDVDDMICIVTLFYLRRFFRCIVTFY